MPAADKPDIFDQPYMPIWCDGCNEQGYIFDKNVFDELFFVVCPHCGREKSNVSCPKCEMGGEFVENIQDRPTSWVCPRCKTSYPLSSRFYDRPKTLYLESDLPEEALAKVAAKGQNAFSLIQLMAPVLMITGMPFLIGALAGLLIDAQMMFLTGFACFLSSIVGFTIISKNTSWRDRIIMVCFSLIPFACSITAPNKAPAWLTLAASYGLGLIYGFAFARFLLWYNSRANKTTAGQS